MLMKLRAFTLVELLVVISIISLLSSVVLSSLNSARAKARDTQRLSDLRQLSVALRTYDLDNDVYPGYGCSSIGTGSGEAYGLDTGSAYSLNPQFVPTYMRKLPADPIYGTRGRNGNYMYFTSGTPVKSVKLCASMESNTGNGNTVTNACGGTFYYNHCINIP